MKNSSNAVVAKTRSDRALAALIAVAAAISDCLVFNGSAAAGIINPHLEKIEGCAQTRQASGNTLNEHSETGLLYFHKLTEADTHSVSYGMLEKHSLDGFIFSRKASPQSTKVEDDDHIVLTGHVYKRDASMFEKLLAGGKDTYSYEARTAGGTYILGTDQLSTLPSRLCEEVGVTGRR